MGRFRITDEQMKLLDLYDKKRSSDRVWESVLEESSTKPDREAIHNAMKLINHADANLLAFIFPSSPPI